MEFTATNASLAGVTFATPCVSGVSWSVATPAGAVSTAASGITLYATELKATLASGPVDWTPVATATSTVPEADPLSGGSGTLTAPVITLGALSAPALSLAHPQTASAIC